MNNLNVVGSVKIANLLNFKGNSKTENKEELTCQCQNCTNSIVNPAYYQNLNGISSSDKQKAIAQIKNFNKTNIVSKDEKILDGFMDGGVSSSIDENGNITSGREIIVVDRRQDKKLQEIINQVKSETKDYTDSEKINYIFYNIVNNTWSKDCAKDESETPENTKMLLGDILSEYKPVCRHRALLFKILADEVGVKTDLVRGCFSYQDIEGKHAWNVAYPQNSSRLIYDSSNNIKAFPHSKMYIHTNPQDEKGAFELIRNSGMQHSLKYALDLVSRYTADNSQHRTEILELMNKLNKTPYMMDENQHDFEDLMDLCFDSDNKFDLKTANNLLDLINDVEEWINVKTQNDSYEALDLQEQGEVYFELVAIGKKYIIDKIDR